MKSIIIIISFVLLLSSCNNQVKRKDGIPEKSWTNIRKVKPKAVERQSNNDLLNYELVGLAYNEKEEDFYKKFYLEFEALCYGGTPAFFINTNEQKIYVFDYIIGQSCKNKIPPLNSIVHIFDVDSIINKNSMCSFYTSRVINTNINSKVSRKILFSFSKHKNEVYELKIYEDGKELQNEFITRYIYYVNGAYSNKFTHEECGDFEG